MIQTAGRLTLYGLISALDVDLRKLVRDEVILNSSMEQALTPEELQKVKERAQKDGVTDPSLYFEYLDFGDSLAILRRNSSLVSTTVNKLIKRQGAHFDKLLPVRNRIMHARPILLTDYPLAEAVAKIVREAPPPFFAGTREFDARVRRDPHHVFSLDMSAVSRDSDRIANNLPLPEYDETGFVGRDNEKQQLKLLCESQWPVITVVGEGGYGKPRWLCRWLTTSWMTKSPRGTPLCGPPRSAFA